MKAPSYKHPDFVSQKADKRIESENKRLWLSLTIDGNAKESLLVILKNPSRATKDISDKTVFTVTKYVKENRVKYPQLKDIGTIIILNLIPFYQTYAALLTKPDLIPDEENIQTITDLSAKHKNVIIAWGNHPTGLRDDFEVLRMTVLNILKVNKNAIFYVDKVSKLGNPKHGQVWGYQNELLPW